LPLRRPRRRLPGMRLALLLAALRVKALRACAKALKSDRLSVL
jgi:hypothetical protein